MANCNSYVHLESRFNYSLRGRYQESDEHKAVKLWPKIELVTCKAGLR